MDSVVGEGLANTSARTNVNEISAAMEIHGRRRYAAPQWDDVFLYCTLWSTL